jgi:hypothetical protein
MNDPHDVEARKWFRRVLIAVCVAGYAVLLWQSIAGPRPAITAAELEQIREGCTETLVPISPGVDMVYYACYKKFSDGSTYSREGY